MIIKNIIRVRPMSGAKISVIRIIGVRLLEDLMVGVIFILLTYQLLKVVIVAFLVM